LGFGCTLVSIGEHLLNIGKALVLGVRFTVNRADVNDFEHICQTNREIVTGLLWT
jgi:hypothetical protein